MLKHQDASLHLAANTSKRRRRQHAAEEDAAFIWHLHDHLYREEWGERNPHEMQVIMI